MRRTSAFRPRYPVAALVLSLAVAGCATAGDGDVAEDANQDTDATPAVTESEQAMAQLALGRDLADYGLENGAPLALATAAEILMGVATEEMEATPEGGEGETDEEAPGPEDLLDEAERLAQGNEALLGAVRRVQQRVRSGEGRGAVGGAADAIFTVSSRSTHTFRITFRGGERASVYINGINRTDLDLWVYDENGNLIGRSISYSDQERVTWVPRWTGPFTIRIRNLGNTWNRYYFAHN